MGLGSASHGNATPPSGTNRATLGETGADGIPRRSCMPSARVHAGQQLLLLLRKATLSRVNSTLTTLPSTLARTMLLTTALSLICS